MTTIFSILTLPKTSNGLTALRSTSTNTNIEDESDLPHKVARSSNDRDSATAFRSKQVSALNEKRKRPIPIQIVGEYKTKHPPGKQQLGLLGQCIRIILNRSSADILPESYEGLYNICRSVVMISHLGHDLYDILKVEFEKSIVNLANEVISSETNDTTWIVFFNDAFKWLENQIVLLQSFLTYLDQAYVVNEKDLLKSRDLAYRLINERVFGNFQIMNKLRNSVAAWLLCERTTGLEHADRNAIQELVQNLLRHHQYAFFEEFYIESTSSFYVEESNTLAEKLKDNPRQFFRHMENRVESEVVRAKAVLPITAWNTVRSFTEAAAWRNRMEWLAMATLPIYMKEREFEPLSQMYTLFSRVEGTEVLKAALSAHVQVTVTDIVKDVDRDDDMVERLLDFKALADQVISSCFVCEKHVVAKTNSDSLNSKPRSSTSQNPALPPDQSFVYALTDSFSMGFKARRSKPAEMIAKYIDRAMRKGQGKASDAEFQEVLDRSLALYRFTDDKDVFRTFYHRSLAKRLLLEKSASDDFERSILKKMKEQFDPEFGMGEEMFKDLALSRDSMNEYHSRLPEHSWGSKMSALVLKQSAWPFAVQKDTLDLPPVMQTELTKYGDYYKSKHTGHALEWIHALGTMVLKARFRGGIKELSVSMYQGITLLLFNASTDISFMDIQEQTNMDHNELRRTLQSLACGKKKLLKKIPPGKEVGDGDMFRYNIDFDDPRPKIHINSIQAKVSPEESRRTNVSIEDDRKCYLDAAIVRIMKSKKEMTYEQLKAATIDEVKKHFVPQVETIKKRIEYLVDQEYLERSEDKNKFLYVA